MIVTNLDSLSYSGAIRLLEEEGYIEQECIEEQVDDIKKFIYPYILYDEKKVIDCIQYIEYCEQIVDDEYEDNRLAWEPIKTEWLHCKGIYRPAACKCQDFIEDS